VSTSADDEDDELDDVDTTSPPPTTAEEDADAGWSAAVEKYELVAGSAAPAALEHDDEEAPGNR